MKNLKLEDGQYVYLNREQGDTIEVKASYVKEPGSSRVRGIYATISPWIISEGGRSTFLGSGIRSLILALPRKSDRALTAVAERLDALVPEAARLFEGEPPEGDPDPFRQKARLHMYGNADRAIALLRDVMVDEVAELSQMAREGV